MSYPYYCTISYRELRNRSATNLPGQAFPKGDLLPCPPDYLLTDLSMKQAMYIHFFSVNMIYYGNLTKQNITFAMYRNNLRTGGTV